LTLSDGQVCLTVKEDAYVRNISPQCAKLDIGTLATLPDLKEQGVHDAFQRFIQFFSGNHIRV